MKDQQTQIIRLYKLYLILNFTIWCPCVSQGSILFCSRTQINFPLHYRSPHLYIMDSPEVRQLSLSLFADIKPSCINISQIALHPGSRIQDLTYNLRELVELLKKHKLKNQKENYTLSTKLADYVFFPLSNLLKWPSLEPDVVRYIFDVIAFLLENSWSSNIDEQLLDQLCPLVVFLCGGQSIQTSKTSEITGTDFLFKSSAVSCLTQLMSCFPRLYFTNEESGYKRLSVLGDSTTLLLDVMCSLKPSINQEENELVIDVLTALETLYTNRVSAEQTSLVFPGLVSKIISFVVSTRNIQVKTVIKILKTLEFLIIKVFDDTGLNVLLNDNSATADSLSSLQTLLNDRDDKQDIVPILILVDAAQHAHRTKLWVTATSKQLKLSLLTLFKHLFFNSAIRTKLSTSALLVDTIFGLVDSLLKNCFESLFAEVIPSTLDILSALVFAVTSESSVSESELLRRIGGLYIQRDYGNLNLLAEQITAKANHLIYKQLPPIIALLNEEKIGVCVAAVKVHLHVLHLLVDILGSGRDSLDLLKRSVLQTITSQIASQDFLGRNYKKANKEDLLSMLSETSAPDKQNTLDDIELPPHINASALTKINKDTNNMRAIQEPSDLRHLMAYWTADTQIENIQTFQAVYSPTSEQHLQSLVQFIGEHSATDFELLLDTVFDSAGGSLLARSVSLWTANHLFQSAPKREESKDFDIDEFLVIEEPKTENVDECGYVLLEQALDILEEVKQLRNDGTEHLKISEMAFVTASQAIETLSCHLSKSDFQTDFLMENLYQLLEALTYSKHSVAHLQARKTLDAIVNNYFEGSLEKLVVENADYLIDSLSMSLSTASGLTPSLPGILLVILKISGVQLLMQNQLHDILSEIFIVIDSYHGYLALVENFFLVFEAIVEITSKIYESVLADTTKIQMGKNASRYKPWGMSNRSQMLDLIDENQRIVDIFQKYDSEQEYFKRTPSVPFGEQEGDSDDEEEDQEQPTEPEEWKLPIPKNIYMQIQQIFTYGLQFLSHPSDKLKAQILKTLVKAYPLMSSNYSVLMPLLAQYWPMILVLASGVSTLSENDATFSLHQLISPALELTKTIITEDAKHEAFMSKRFIEMWDFWKKKSPLFNQPKRLSTEQQVSRNGVLPKVSQLYASTLLTGLKIYEKIVPDLAAIEIMEACTKLGVGEQLDMSRDNKALLWVLTAYQRPI